jgi:serine/threonine protein kinase
MSADEKTNTPVKICPTCRLQFDFGEVSTLCPNDKTLLAIVKTDPLIGQVINDRYQIVSAIGKGGWSRVYRALDLSLNRDVSIKILHSHLTEDLEKVKRFQLEAEATAKLSHPNVIAIFDYGITDDGSAYIVMEYLEGSTLEVTLPQNGALDWTKALPMFFQICDGLAEAHKQGIIHRDVKPSNIFIVAGAEPPVVKILDFGIARLVAEDRTVLTKSGETMGTPAYMSPEQCMGQPLDQRSDLYSFGCVMFEVLSGKKAFTGDLPMEIMWKHLKDATTSLKAIDTETSIPLQLRQIILKTMSKDPAERYATASELRKDLVQFEHHPTRSFRIKKNWTGALRERTRLALVLAILILLPVAGYLYGSISGFESGVMPYEGDYERRLRGAVMEDPSGTNMAVAWPPGSTNIVNVPFSEDTAEKKSGALKNFSAEADYSGVAVISPGNNMPPVPYPAESPNGLEALDVPKDYIEKALKEFDKQIKQDPKNAALYFERAILHLLGQNDSKAAKEFLEFSKLSVDDSYGKAYGAALASIVYKRAGLNKEAELAAQSTTAPDGTMEYRVLNFAKHPNDSSAESELLTEASRAGKLKYMYDATLLLALAKYSSDPEAALKYLMWMEENSFENPMEGMLATNEIQRLRRSGRWKRPPRPTREDRSRFR